MKKLSFKITGFLFFINSIALAQSGIEWGETVLLNNEPIIPKEKSLTKDTDQSRAVYGSQYGRMLELDANAILAAYTISRNKGYKKQPDGGFELEIARSTDKGRHWKKISLITDKGRDLDNAQMIQLKDKSILLACRSVRWQESYRLLVYRSIDNGQSWTRLSMVDANEGKPEQLGKPDKGVYEPHFLILDDGRLSVMYANEKHVTDSISYSQIISQKISADNGKTWGKEIWVAYEPGQNASRPGMPVWTKMKNGNYIVVYEICGPQNCNVYYKISEDGFTWPVGLGTLIPEQTGGPYILSLTDGKLIVSSNKGNISISEDFGQSWHTTQRPWHHKKDFSADWTQTIWSALYQTASDEVCVVASIQREEGGHNMQMRFGKINNKPPTQASNNVIALADPTIFYDDGVYYLYGTGGNTEGFLVYTSRDLKSWKGAEGINNGYALIKGDSYGLKGFWAPQVFKNGDTFYMIYTADENIAIAQSNSPLGPFKQQSLKAFSGTTKQIDPFVFIDDDGKKYLYHVKLQNGNRLFVAEMKDDFSDIKPGTLKECIAASKPWENTANAPWPVAEGPTVIKHNGLYYLLYSANDFRNIDYAVGYAVSDSPTGPWKKSDGPPLINREQLKLNGPGHGDILQLEDSSLLYVLHTHASSQKVHPRLTGVLKINFTDDTKPAKLQADIKSFHYLNIKSDDE